MPLIQFEFCWVKCGVRNIHIIPLSERSDTRKMWTHFILQLNIEWNYIDEKLQSRFRKTPFEVYNFTSMTFAVLTLIKFGKTIFEVDNFSLMRVCSLTSIEVLIFEVYNFTSMIVCPVTSIGVWKHTLRRLQFHFDESLPCHFDRSSLRWEFAL